LRILFGPDHDHPQVSPDRPGAYEWWYFDALSDDGRFALVVILFLGAPMSPYYKAVATGKPSSPLDWCGAFVSLHENRGERWRERAYAYNLYGGDEFGATTQTVGGTRIVRENGADGVALWRVTADEPGLWRGRTQAQMTFALPGPPLQLPAMGADDDAAHTWVCVAPVCRAEGTVTLASGETIPFLGNGYHDHNFGVLPYADAAYWQWGRVPLRRTGETAPSRTTVYYHIAPPAPAGNDVLAPPPQTTLLVFDALGQPLTARTVSAVLPPGDVGGSYGMRYERTLLVGDAGQGEPTLTATACDRAGVFSNGPFYARFPIHAELAEVAEPGGVTPAVWRGDGVGEAFRPGRLLGPVASRAMWSRIRRRRGGGGL